MVQSSQSEDISSEDDDDDANCSLTSEANSEDCAAGEWAAALVAVADQSIDQDGAHALLTLGQQLRDRSISESSESSSGSSGSYGSMSTTSSSDRLSKSPIGFWYVRPGSSSIENASSDDGEPICWTPSLQSSSHPVTSDSLLSLDVLNLDEVVVGPPHILFPSVSSTSNLGKLLSESTSGARGLATAALDESSHPSSNADDEFGPITPPSMNQGVPPPAVGCFSSFKPLKKMTMSRSMSYSAFTYNTGLAPNSDFKPKLLSQSTVMRTSLSSTQENDLFRTYFMKFVDLLVVRETERLVHSKETPKAETAV